MQSIIDSKDGLFATSVLQNIIGFSYSKYVYNIDEMSVIKISTFLNSMIDTAEELSKNFTYKLTMNNNITNSRYTNSKKNNVTEHSDKRKIKSKEENYTNNSNISKKKLANLEKIPLPKKINMKTLENNIYKEKPEKRRNLLKEQCSLNIINLEKDGLKLLNTQKKEKMLESKYLNLNHILNKNKEENMKTENAKLEELINYQDEKTKKNIPTRNNTIITDPVFFNRVRILFDTSKSKNVKLFDYSDNVDLIIRIQTLYRSLLAKRKFRILKYVSHKITQIQKIVKGMITRRKYNFFIQCSRSVLFIQALYKLHFKRKNEKAKKIQRYYRQKIKEREERDKLLLKKKLEMQKEKYTYINVDKIMEKVLTNKKEKDLHKAVFNLGKNIEEVNNDIKRKQVKLDVTKELIDERNPENIIDLLLYSQLPEDTKTIRKKVKRSKSDIFKIEDKLIHDGQIQKERREKLGKMKEIENSKIPEYNPKISKKNEMIMKKYPDNFLKRVEYFQLFKKRNIENLRNKNYLAFANELRFEPKINEGELYNDIHSKFFNIFNEENENGMKLKNKKLFNNKENFPYKDKSDETIWKENLRDGSLSNSYIISKNLSNSLKFMNNNEIKDIEIPGFNRTRRDIWPKDIKNKYLYLEPKEKANDNE